MDRFRSAKRAINEAAQLLGQPPFGDDAIHEQVDDDVFDPENGSHVRAGVKELIRCRTEAEASWMKYGSSLRSTRSERGPKEQRVDDSERTLAARGTSAGVPTRAEALAFLVANEARKLGDVVAFRAEVLGNQILKPEDIERWLHERCAVDGPPTQHMTIETPEALLQRDAEGYVIPIERFTPIRDFQTENVVLESQVTESLPYWAPGRRYPVYIPINQYGQLGWLKRLAELLAWLFPCWSEQPALVFVLTDQPPEIPEIRTSLNMAGGGHRGTSRVIMDIDPATSPSEVAAQYAATRAKITPGTRVRPLSDRHVTLAVFAAEREEEVPSQSAMDDWNALYPGWHYGQRSNFQRDYKRAIKMILNPDYRSS